jgi:hypothetical protein
VCTQERWSAAVAATLQLSCVIDRTMALSSSVAGLASWNVPSPSSS